MARSDPRPASLNQSPTISRAQLGGNDIGNGATPTPSGRNIAAAARSSPAPTGSARKPSLVIFTQDGQKTSRARANKADGQRAVNAYFAEHGYWPQAFKDGNFTVKRVREQEAAAGPSQEEGSEQTPSSPKRKIGIDTLGSNAKRQNQGGEISSGRNNFGIPAPARKRKLSPDAEDSGPKRKTTQASSSAGREDLNSYYPAPAQSLARSIAPGKRQLNADTEESAPKRKTTEAAFTAGGEGLHSDSLTPEQGSPQPQLQSRESAPQLDFDLPLIPDFETDLPPIPDIQKSFHQLEQEALYNGIRPSWFSRAEWNKPIPTEWPNFEPESDSDEVEGDAEERRDYLERTKATQGEYGSGANSLWKAKPATFFHALELRRYYSERYPWVPSHLIEERIQAEYPLTEDLERRCVRAAYVDAQRCRDHNNELVLARRAEGQREGISGNI